MYIYIYLCAYYCLLSSIDRPTSIVFTSRIIQMLPVSWLKLWSSWSGMGNSYTIDTNYIEFADGIQEFAK